MKGKLAFLVLLLICIISSLDGKKQKKKKKEHSQVKLHRRTGTHSAKDSHKKKQAKYAPLPKALKWVSNKPEIFKDSFGDIVISHHAIGAAKKNEIEDQKKERVTQILKRSINNSTKKKSHKKKKKIVNKLVYQNGKTKYYQDKNGDLVVSHHERNGHKKDETPKDENKKDSQNRKKK